MNDAAAMGVALGLARRALGTTAPNPPVGAVLVRDGRVIGEGWTRPPGGPHAEVVALADARARGEDPRGATMVVTLEPCCHHGRTPPCTDAILAAGIERVVVGVVDPYPPMRGKALELLRGAGVQVTLGVGEQDCSRVALGFRRVVEGGLPEVTLKVATSLDGKLATAAGESQWITGEQARADVHRERAMHDAVLVGSGTVRSDDPALTCRVDGGRDPVPVVLDTELKIPAAARLLKSSRRAVIVCADDAPDRALDADVVRVPRAGEGVDLRAALRALGERGLHRVMVEGGGRVHRALLDADVVDTVLVYVAGMVIPGGQSWLAGSPIARLADAPRFGAPDITALGDDVRLRYPIRRQEG